MTPIPQRVLDACIGLENATGGATFGIHYDAERPAWVISDQHEEVAHLNPHRFGGTPEDEAEKKQ